MKVFMVYAHPEPTSFNGALMTHAAEVLEAAGHEFVVTDLYADGYDARAGRGDFLEVADPARFDYQVEQKHAAESGTFAPEIARDQERLYWCDLLIFQFPLWWFGPPAILKGWFDRTLAFGKIYDLGHRYQTGMLQGRTGMISTTTGGPEERFSGADGQYEKIDIYLKPIEFGCIEYMGMKLADRFVAWSAGRVGDEGRQAYLDQWAKHLLAVTSGEAVRQDVLASVEG